MEPLLKFEHVTICYNGENVVQDINLELNRGEILGVVGESGSGKSTIIKAVMGLLGNEGMVTEGDIWYKGKNVVDMQEKELRTLLRQTCVGNDGEDRAQRWRACFKELSF